MLCLKVGFVLRIGGISRRYFFGQGGAIGFVFRPFLSQLAHSKPHIGFVSPEFCPFSRLFSPCSSTGEGGVDRRVTAERGASPRSTEREISSQPRFFPLKYAPTCRLYAVAPRTLWRPNPQHRAHGASP